MAAIKLAPVPAPEEEQIIKTRFLNQVSVARGEPPFKRLTKRFLALCEEAERGGSGNGLEVAHQAFLREISTLELQVEKQAAILTANEREQQAYRDKQEQLLSQIEQAKRDIEARKLELEEARIARQHKEEYEVLRSVLVHNPARAATQRDIDAVNSAIDKITAESRRVSALLQRRRQQFALLFHVIEELQRTMDEPEEEDNGNAAAAQPGAMEVDV